MAQTKIEWTELSWNPTTGCDKISAGCKFCYAEIMSKRLKAMGVEKYNKNFKFSTHAETLKIPYTWKKPRIVFVNSMSDLFHEKNSLAFIKKVFNVMNENPQHVFQLLTKRADILLKFNAEVKWSHNIWMGVSIENSEVIERVNLLRQTNARVKFLSCEPLIGPLDNINLSGLDWVIVGGESGKKPRPIDPEWVISIQNQCVSKNIPFFFKQWGGRSKKKSGRILNGKLYNEMPNIHSLI